MIDSKVPEVDWLISLLTNFIQLNTCEEELTKTRLDLESAQKLAEEQSVKVETVTVKNEELEEQLTQQRENEKDKIEILNIDLEAAKSVSETQKTELEYLKAELEKESGSIDQAAITQLDVILVIMFLNRTKS